MSKRKSPKDRELPLFDLPLHANDEEPEAVDVGDAIVEDAGDLPIGSPRERSAAASYAGEIDRTLREIPQEPEAAVPAAGPAPLKDRFLSGALDLGIQVLVLGAAVAAVRAIGAPVRLADGLPFAIFGLIFSFLYWFIPLAFWGQTPGMAWVGNSAVRLNDEPLTFGQTLLRWIGALLTLALAGLPLLLAFGGGRSLSDRLSDSKTEVI